MDDMKESFGGGFVERDPDDFLFDGEGMYRSVPLALSLAGLSAVMRLRHDRSGATIEVRLGDIPDPLGGEAAPVASLPIEWNGGSYAALMTTVPVPLVDLSRVEGWRLRVFDLQRESVLLGIRRPAEVPADEEAHLHLSRRLFDGLPSALETAFSERPRMFDDFRMGVAEGEIARLLEEQLGLWTSVVGLAQAMENWRKIAEGVSDKSGNFENVPISSWKIPPVDRFHLPAGNSAEISGGLLSLELADGPEGRLIMARTIDGVEHSIRLADLPAVPKVD